MAQKILTHQTRIKNDNKTRRMIVSEAVGFEIEMPTGVADVITVVDSRKIPLL